MNSKAFNLFENKRHKPCQKLKLVTKNFTCANKLKTFYFLALPLHYYKRLYGLHATRANRKKDVFFYYFYIDTIFRPVYNKTYLIQGGIK